MIISFTIENFRSFNAETTLSLVASKRLNDHADHAVPIPGSDKQEHVLRLAVLYGANSAGKSNLVKALEFAVTTATKPKKRTSGTGREVFRYSTDERKPTVFDIHFMAENKVFRYGCKLDDYQILEEWLVQVKGKNETLVFERATDSEGKVKVVIGRRSLGDKVKALALVGGPANQTFLATVMATVEREDVKGDLHAIIGWFTADCKIIHPDAHFGPMGSFLVDSDEFRQFASGFLKGASTGVSELIAKKEPITEEALLAMLPKALHQRVREDLALRDGESTIIGLPDCELIVESTGDNKFYRVSIVAAHDGHSGDSSLSEFLEESDGTRRLLELLPALYELSESGATYVVDEIDRSMHPLLVRMIVEYFLNNAKGNSQLIITTHESSLLDLDLLRRDEIWFAEKDLQAATSIHSLSDFRVRTDLEIRKHYFQGRFGGIPFLGDLKKLAYSGQQKEDESNESKATSSEAR